jgi:[glutamine synthetase] adenylyltransferase / [glutamine synthetase]-adenylyl-L-tyrosine phosphorylase
MSPSPADQLDAILRDRLSEYPDLSSLERRLTLLQRLPDSVLEAVVTNSTFVQRLTACVVAGDAPVQIAVRLAGFLQTALADELPVYHANLSFAENHDLGWLHTAIREQTGEFSVEQSTARYAELADELSNRALAELNTADPGLLLFALGKWGGSELNACSDIDPVFFATAELTPETADRRVREWNQTMSGTREHPVYTVDLRLRPEGDAGPLACSLNIAEQYFLRRASFWERIAWLRARSVSNDEPGWFRELLDYFLFRTGGDLREKMNRVAMALDGIHQSARPRDLKRSPGGIRDIEFLVASFQLAEGQHEIGLRSGSISGLLRRLGEIQLISHDYTEMLLSAYHFHRRLEHTLQVGAGKSQFIVPDTGSASHARVSYAMNMKPDAFENELQKQQQTVKSITNELLLDSAEVVTPGYTAPDPQSEVGATELLSGALDSRSKAILNRLSGKWGPASRLFDAELVLSSPSVIDALSRLEAAVQAYGGPGSWAAAFASRPKILSEISRLLLHGRRIVEEATTRPFLWERIGTKASPDFEKGSVERLSEQLGDLTFHLGEAFVAGDVNSEELTRDWTRGVDRIASLLANVELNETEDHPPIALLASGKWGGQELAPDGDLDLLFVCDEANSDQLSAAIQTATRFMASLSLNGRLTPDARLRPEGSGSPLCVTISRLENYLQTRGAPWEKIGLARARFVAGNPTIGENAERVLREFIATPPPAQELSQIQMARKKASQLVRVKPGTLRIKKGVGGMMDFEFAVAFASWRLQLAADKSWAASMFERMRYLSEFDSEHAEMWNLAFPAYSELRRWELVQSFASSHRRGDVPVSGPDADRFAEAAGMTVPEIKSKWDVIRKLGRELYDTMATSLA